MFGSKFFPNENGFPATKNPAVFNMFKQLVLTLSGQYHLEINNKNLSSNKQADI